MSTAAIDISSYVCSVDGCDLVRRTRRMCQKHYAQVRRQEKRDGRAIGTCQTCQTTLPYLGVGRPKRICDECRDARPIAQCSVDGCDKSATARGWCAAHYKFWQKHGVPGDASDKRRKVAGPDGSSRSNDGNGYVRLWFPDPSRPGGGRHVLEHRYVMEQLLGRPLAAHENIHHKNGLRSDNRPENLELWVTSQPKGQRPADLAEWVVEHYPELVEAALSKRSQLRLVG